MVADIITIQEFVDFKGEKKEEDRQRIWYNERSFETPRKYIMIKIIK